MTNKKRELTDEQKAKIADGLRKARENKIQKPKTWSGAIHIVDRYYFDSDGDQFILGKRSALPAPETGDYSYQTVGYFTSMESLLMAMLNRSDLDITFKNDKQIELADALRSMRESRQLIRETIGKALK